MRLFSDFLIEKNLVTKAALLSAVLEQLRKLPSLPDLISSLQLLTPDQLYEGLKYQAFLKCDLRHALVNLGYWNAQIEVQVQEQWTKLRTPLGEILVSLGHLSATDLESSLTEYRSQAVSVCDAFPFLSDKKLTAEQLEIYCLLQVPEKTQKAKEVFLESGETGTDFKKYISRVQGAARLLELHRIDQICETIAKSIGADVVNLLETLVQTTKDIIDPQKAA